MELLAEITEEGLGLRRRRASKYRVRKTARAVLLDMNGRVALFHSAKWGYYKVPGGGIERGESPEEALRREVLEETGYKSRAGNELGVIMEYRDRIGLLQISYCYTATTEGTQASQRLTKSELRERFSLEWHSMEDATAIVRERKSSDYFRSFIRARELALLEKARAVLG